jgi:excisionase family DNA binding protein
MSQPPALRIADVSALLGVEDSAVRRYCRQRRIKHYKIGNTIRFRREDVDTFIESCAVVDPIPAKTDARLKHLRSKNGTQPNP